MRRQGRPLLPPLPLPAAMWSSHLALPLLCLLLSLHLLHALRGALTVSLLDRRGSLPRDFYPADALCNFVRRMGFQAALPKLELTAPRVLLVVHDRRNRGPRPPLW